MKTVSGDVTTALAATEAAIVQLIKLDFPSGAVLLNTSNWALVWDGDTYLGANGLGTISAIEDAPGEVRGLQFELSGAASAAISLALDGADEWQGTPVTILTALFDMSDYTIIDAGVEFTGLGDTLTIQEDGENAVIQATVESSAVDLLRGVPITYTHADQQVLYPGDLAFQYVNDQADQPIVWPAKEWFRK